MKRLHAVFLINRVGLLIFFFVLLDAKSFSTFFHSNKSMMHCHPVAINKGALRQALMKCSDERLLKMYVAGCEICQWNHGLEKKGSHVVKELLKGQGIFYKSEHYPQHDVYDPATYAQYYYHAHREGEHGHFHLFLRQGGMPKGVLPKFYDQKNNTMNDVDTFSHLIAISMDEKGCPIKLFTTNRWVTGETWYRSEDVCQMIDLFQIEHSHPSWITNQWLSSILQLFYPQISALILRREEDLQTNSQDLTLIDAMENYNLEVLSEMEISIMTQMNVLKDVIAERRIKVPHSHN